jgi:hypothetical protein
MRIFPTDEPDAFGDKQEGMELRDYFAAHAMAALISLPDLDMDRNEIVQAAFKYADLAMGWRDE